MSVDRPNLRPSDADAPFPPPPAAEAAIEVVRPVRPSPFLLLCDHATNQIPAALGDLGLPSEDLARHIAYDVGVRGVTLALSELLDAPAILSTFSRLVIDPNRGEDDPTLLMRLYDRTLIPGNARADAAERERRLAALHRPYHGAIERAMADATAAGRPPILIAIHSFTPQLRGKPPRPWHVGVLWDRDARTARALLDSLRADHDLVVGDNQPYNGALPGDTMDRHGNRTGAPHALIEIRNDLIDTPARQRRWAERLAPILSEIAALTRDDGRTG